MAVLSRSETFVAMGRKGGKSQSNTRKWPLRKVVGFDSVRDHLECGHTVSASHDFGGKGGRRYPDRRRCYACYKRQPSEGGE